MANRPRSFFFILHRRGPPTFLFFFLNDPPPPEIYTLPLHDALPISGIAPKTEMAIKVRSFIGPHFIICDAARLPCGLMPVRSHAPPKTKNEKMGCHRRFPQKFDPSVLLETVVPASDVDGETSRNCL